MDGRSITLVPLTIKQIYDEQLKFKKGKMIENESLYVRKTFFANKVLSGYDVDVMFFGLVLICFIQGMIFILYIQTVYCIELKIYREILNAWLIEIQEHII